MQTAREVPNSVDAEFMVIGAIAAFPACWPDVVNCLAADDFFRRVNQQAFEYALELDRRNRAVDGVMISSFANDQGDVETAIHVQEAANACLSAANVLAYARVVREKRIEREMLAASYEIGKLAYEGNALEDKLGMVQKIAYEIGVDGSGDDAVHVSSVLSDVVRSLGERSSGVPLGASTGFQALDFRWGGLRKSNLIVLAGRPAMGKTTLALNIIENVCAAGGRALVFSLEMDSEELVEKTISSVGGIFYKDLNTAEFFNNAEQRDRYDRVIPKIRDFDLTLEDRGGITLSQIRAKARKHASEKPIDLIVVDYLQLVQGSDSKQSIYERVTEITRGFKQLAKDLSCPVLLLSQLNRKCDERPYGKNRPIMSDLRDSGSIEQDADIVAFVYRDVIYNETTNAPHIAEVITAKQRKGIVGTDYFREDFKHSRFQDYAGQKPDYGVRVSHEGYEA